MKSSYKKIDELVERVDERNSDGSINNLVGLSIDKCFINSVANTIGTDLSKYKIIRNNYFAVSLMQVSRDSKIPIARFLGNEAIMSPAYSIFRVKDENVVLPEYIDLWFKRAEFDREAAFIAVGGVRGSMPYEEFSRMEILIPDIEIQRKIVNDYNIVSARIDFKRRINDNLDEQMNALFKSWFVDFDPFNVSEESSIPNGWTQTKLGDYVTYTQGTQVPVEDQYESPADNRIRFLRIVDYTGTTNDPPRYIDKKRKNTCCNPDDILIIRYGASAGQICRGFAGVFANNLFSITPEKRLTKSFLYYLLTQSTVQSFITSVGETSSAMPALTHGLISAIPFALPDTDDYINKFSVIADKCFIQQMNNAKEIEQLLLLQNSILQSLLSR